MTCLSWSRSAGPSRLGHAAARGAVSPPCPARSASSGRRIEPDTHDRTRGRIAESLRSRQPAGAWRGGDAVAAESAGENARQASVRAARQRGHALGAAERDRLRPGRLGAERALSIAEALLAGHGFEPARPAPAEVELRNCPFHPLAARAPELVCGINHAFLAGMLDGLGADVLDAQLCPQAGKCCVRLRAAPPRSESAAAR
jgi:hypothetical protein